MPEQRPQDPNKRLGKTVGLLLHLCKSIYLRGFVVILDSVFCVLRGIVELWKKGVFAAAVIKERKFWPKHVPGAAMDERMEAKAVGNCDSLPGTLEGILYNLFVLKDAGYMMKIMSTYGSLLVNDGQKILFDITKLRRPQCDKKVQVFPFLPPISLLREVLEHVVSRPILLCEN
jgi:hypothetical protein